MTESVQSCLELSIHLSVKRTSRELLLKIVRGKKYREMYEKFKVTRDLQRCLAFKRCSASSLNCRYLNSYIKLKLIELTI